MQIKLPETLTVSLQDGPIPPGRWWRDGVSSFIVLSFGRHEVARWEWQADRPLDSRTDPDQDDAEEFVALKLRELLQPRPPVDDTTYGPPPPGTWVHGKVNVDVRTFDFEGHAIVVDRSSDQRDGTTLIVRGITDKPGGVHPPSASPSGLPHHPPGARGGS